MYDDEDVYDQLQDERIERESILVSQPIPEPVPYTIEASLLSVGDLVCLPALSDLGVRPGTAATVARVFPFQGGATIECELEVGGREVQAILYDDPGVVLLIPAGRRSASYVRWTGVPA